MSEQRIYWKALWLLPGQRRPGKPAWTTRGAMALIDLEFFSPRLMLTCLGQEPSCLPLAQSGATTVHLTDESQVLAFPPTPRLTVCWTVAAVSSPWLPGMCTPPIQLRLCLLPCHPGITTWGPHLSFSHHGPGCWGTDHDIAQSCPPSQKHPLYLRGARMT